MPLAPPSPAPLPRPLRGETPRALAACMAGSLCTLVACVEPEHPCDPQSDPNVQRTAALSGRVLDQGDNPVPGVTVSVSGRAETTLSQEDGSFVIDSLPPNEGEAGYELVAVPPAPLVGGTLTATPLRCYGEVTDLVLRVARPPPTPEVEIVQAVEGERLLVAFSPGAMPLASDEATRYRVELRTPFGEWRTARIACGDGALAPDPATDVLADTERSVDDACAQHLCSAYAYALPALAEPAARCVHVVGWEGMSPSEAPESLDPDAEFQVRVQSEVALPEALVAQRIPAALASPLTPTPGRGRLLPLGQMPVALAPTADEHSHAMGELELECILPTGPGRFAMVENGALRVVGLADRVAADRYAGATLIGESSMALDEATNLAANARLAEDEGETLAVLPAGRWLRVLRRVRLPGGAGYATRFKKVFIGAERVDEEHAPVGAEPRFGIDLAGTGLRGFTWLRRPAGRLVDYRPADGYVMVFPQSLVVAEREDLACSERSPGDLECRECSPEDLECRERSPEDLECRECSPLARNFNLLRQRIWADHEANDGSICGQIGSFAQAHDDDNARLTLACVNLARGLHLPLLRLSPAEILSASDPALPADAPPVDGLSRTVHVLLDAHGNQALVIPSDHLAGATDAPLVDSVQRVPLGAEPVAAHPSRLLSCAASGSSATQVLLVANAGSQDVSVLAITDDTTRAVAEVAVIPLPAPPRSFLMDPDGPTCASPYSWVLLEDGSTVPLDLREGQVRVPTCGNAPCRIQGQGRVVTGGISRDAEGRARVVLGGRAALAEVGFLRPAQGARTAP